MNFDTGRAENILSRPGTGCTATPSQPSDIAPLISSFPKTRYYGSKRRLLEWIYHSVKDQQPQNVDAENKPQNQMPPSKLEELILLALADKWQTREYFTTTEIAQLVNQHFNLNDKPKSKNNIS